MDYKERNIYKGPAFQLRPLISKLNAHQLHLKTGLRYETTLQYINKPETVKAVDLATLYRILKALDLDLSQLAFLDVFTENNDAQTDME